MAVLRESADFDAKNIPSVSRLMLDDTSATVRLKGASPPIVNTGDTPHRYQWYLRLSPTEITDVFPPGDRVARISKDRLGSSLLLNDARSHTCHPILSLNVLVKAAHAFQVDFYQILINAFQHDWLPF